MMKNQPGAGPPRGPRRASRTPRCAPRSARRSAGTPAAARSPGAPARATRFARCSAPAEQTGIRRLALLGAPDTCRRVQALRRFPFQLAPIHSAPIRPATAPLCICRLRYPKPSTFQTPKHSTVAPVLHGPWAVTSAWARGTPEVASAAASAGFPASSAASASARASPADPSDTT